MEMTDLESTATLMITCYAIQNLLGLSNEILCIQVVEGAAKQQEVKVKASKKGVISMPGKKVLLQINRSNFFRPSTLTFKNLQHLEPHKLTEPHLKVLTNFERYSI